LASMAADEVAAIVNTCDNDDDARVCRIYMPLKRYTAVTDEFKNASKMQPRELVMLGLVSVELPLTTSWIADSCSNSCGSHQPRMMLTCESINAGDSRRVFMTFETTETKSSGFAC
jgi:hypothetical protein